MSKDTRYLNLTELEQFSEALSDKLIGRLEYKGEIPLLTESYGRSDWNDIIKYNNPSLPGDVYKLNGYGNNSKINVKSDGVYEYFRDGDFIIVLNDVEEKEDGTLTENIKVKKLSSPAGLPIDNKTILKSSYDDTIHTAIGGYEDYAEILNKGIYIGKITLTSSEQSIDIEKSKFENNLFNESNVYSHFETDLYIKDLNDESKSDTRGTWEDYDSDTTKTPNYNTGGYWNYRYRISNETDCYRLWIKAEQPSYENEVELTLSCNLRSPSIMHYVNSLFLETDDVSIENKRNKLYAKSAIEIEEFPTSKNNETIYRLTKEITVGDKTYTKGLYVWGKNDSGVYEWISVGGNEVDNKTIKLENGIIRTTVGGYIDYIKSTDCPIIGVAYYDSVAGIKVDDTSLHATTLISNFDFFSSSLGRSFAIQFYSNLNNTASNEYGDITKKSEDHYCVETDNYVIDFYKSNGYIETNLSKKDGTTFDFDSFSCSIYLPNNGMGSDSIYHRIYSYSVPVDGETVEVNYYDRLIKSNAILDKDPEEYKTNVIYRKESDFNYKGTDYSAGLYILSSDSSKLTRIDAPVNADEETILTKNINGEYVPINTSLGGYVDFKNGSPIKPYPDTFTMTYKESDRVWLYNGSSQTLELTNYSSLNAFTSYVEITFTDETDPNNSCMYLCPLRIINNNLYIFVKNNNSQRFKAAVVANYDSVASKGFFRIMIEDNDISHSSNVVKCKLSFHEYETSYSIEHPELIPIDKTMEIITDNTNGSIPNMLRAKSAVETTSISAIARPLSEVLYRLTEDDEINFEIYKAGLYVYKKDEDKWIPVGRRYIDNNSIIETKNKICSTAISGYTDPINITNKIEPVGYIDILKSIDTDYVQISLIDAQQNRAWIEDKVGSNFGIKISINQNDPVYEQGILIDEGSQFFKVETDNYKIRFNRINDTRERCLLYKKDGTNIVCDTLSVSFYLIYDVGYGEYTTVNHKIIADYIPVDNETMHVDYYGKYLYSTPILNRIPNPDRYDVLYRYYATFIYKEKEYPGGLYAIGQNENLIRLDAPIDVDEETIISKDIDGNIVSAYTEIGGSVIKDKSSYKSWPHTFNLSYNSTDRLLYGMDVSANHFYNYSSRIEFKSYIEVFLKFDGHSELNYKKYIPLRSNITVDANKNTYIYADYNCETINDKNKIKVIFSGYESGGSSASSTVYVYYHCDESYKTYDTTCEIKFYEFDYEKLKHPEFIPVDDQTVCLTTTNDTSTLNMLTAKSALEIDKFSDVTKPKYEVLYRLKDEDIIEGVTYKPGLYVYDKDTSKWKAAVTQTEIDFDNKTIIKNKYTDKICTAIGGYVVDNSTYLTCKNITMSGSEMRWDSWTATSTTFDSNDFFTDDCYVTLVAKDMNGNILPKSNLHFKYTSGGEGIYNYNYMDTCSEGGVLSISILINNTSSTPSCVITGGADTSRGISFYSWWPILDNILEGLVCVIFSNKNEFISYIDSKFIKCKENGGIEADTNDGIYIKPADNSLTLNDNGIKVNVDTSSIMLDTTSNKLKVHLAENSCIKCNSTEGIYLSYAEDSGLSNYNTDLKVKLSPDSCLACTDTSKGIYLNYGLDSGLEVTDNKLKIKPSKGLTLDNTGLNIKLQENSGLIVSNEGLKVCLGAERHGLVIDEEGRLNIKLNDDSALYGNIDGTLKVQLGTPSGLNKNSGLAVSCKDGIKISDDDYVVLEHPYSSGTALPTTANDGDIFFLYTE